MCVSLARYPSYTICILSTPYKRGVPAFFQVLPLENQSFHPESSNLIIEHS